MRFPFRMISLNYAKKIMFHWFRHISLDWPILKTFFVESIRHVTSVQLNSNNMPLVHLWCHFFLLKYKKKWLLYWTDSNWTMGCKYIDEYELLPHKNKRTHKLWFKSSLLKAFFIWIKLQNGYNHRTYVEYIISVLLNAHTNPIMCSYQCRYLIISIIILLCDTTIV